MPAISIALGDILWTSMDLVDELFNRHSLRIIMDCQTNPLRTIGNLQTWTLSNRECLLHHCRHSVGDRDISTASERCTHQGLAKRLPFSIRALWSLWSLAISPIGKCWCLRIVEAQWFEKAVYSPLVLRRFRNRRSDCGHKCTPMSVQWGSDF